MWLGVLNHNLIASDEQVNCYLMKLEEEHAHLKEGIEGIH